jgi:hypothetical protein
VHQRFSRRGSIWSVSSICVIEHGQVQARARLGIIALAGAELQFAQPDQPALGAVLRQASTRMAKQMIGAGKSRVSLVHGEVENAGDADRPGARSIRRASGCGACGLRVRRVPRRYRQARDRRSTFTA